MKTGRKMCSRDMKEKWRMRTTRNRDYVAEERNRNGNMMVEKNRERGQGRVGIMRRKWEREDELMEGGRV